MERREKAEDVPVVHTAHSHTQAYTLGDGWMGCVLFLGGLIGS